MYIYILYSTSTWPIIIQYLICNHIFTSNLTECSLLCICHWEGITTSHERWGQALRALKSAIFREFGNGWTEQIWIRFSPIHQPPGVHYGSFGVHLEYLWEIICNLPIATPIFDRKIGRTFNLHLKTPAPRLKEQLQAQHVVLEDS